MDFTQIMSLRRLKELLLPKAMKPIPLEMIPFTPEPEEPVKVTKQQVRHGVSVL